MTAGAASTLTRAKRRDRLHPRLRATACAEACARSGYEVDAARRRALAQRATSRASTRSSSASAPSTHPRAARAHHERLMRYVEARRHAGRAVQHQQPRRAARPPRRPLPARDRPRPRHRRDRGDDARRPERAAAARRPTASTAADFEGWVQERGLYFAAKWDERYQPVFAHARSGRGAARRAALLVGAPRQGPLRLHRASRSSGSCPPACPGAYRLLREPARAMSTPMTRRRAETRRRCSAPGATSTLLVLGELARAGRALLRCSRGGRTVTRARLGGARRHASASSSSTASWKTRGVADIDELPARRQRRCAGRPSASHHGHAGQRHHVPLDAGPGLRGRHALRAVLLRAAARDGRHQRGVRADLLPAQGLHRLRVPRAPLRRADAR